MPEQPNNITYNIGNNIETAELNDDNNLSILDRMNVILEELYTTSKDNLEQLLICPEGKRRGWKILDGDYVVEFAPCGCYDDALWPIVLGIPAAAKAGAKIASKILVKKAKKKWRKEALKFFKGKVEELRSSYEQGLKLLFNMGILRRKLPPVKPGYTRLYRGQGVRRLQQRAKRNIDLHTPNVLRDKTDIPNFGVPDGKYWTDDINYANIFTFPDNELAGYTKESEIYFIDILTTEAQKLNLGSSRNLGDATNLKMIEGQKYLTEAGAKFNDVLKEFTFPPSTKMPLRRRNSQGIIEIVIDTPNSKLDIDLNPGVFAWNAESAASEFYLDSSLYGTNFLKDAADSANLARESSTQVFLRLKEKTNKVLEQQDKLSRLLDGDGIPDSANVSKFISSLESTAKDLASEIDRIFDVYDTDLPGNSWGYAIENLRKMSQSSFSLFDYIKIFLPWFLGLLVFIDIAMSLITIVKDKSCIPLMEGGLSEFSNKPRMARIRNQRIQNKASVWAELNPETCKCSECPEDWNFCDQSSLANLYLKETNTCIPPCCGNQEFKPITLIETCKCDCPEGQVFMPCECSDCTQSDSFITRLFNPSKPGICVEINPDPEKLEWNPKSCSWECKNYTIEYPPILFGAPTRKPLPPCENNKIRKPKSCECSGSYSIKPCNSITNNTYNIVPFTELNIVE
jgi:hypothetical protein